MSLRKLFEIYGVSPWLDNLTRTMLDDGTLQNYIQSGVRGITSNPSIFEHAIVNSNAYDGEARRLFSEGLDPEGVYWELAKQDVAKAADIFLPLFQQSGGNDGFISIEVSPLLAQNAELSLKQAKQLWTDIDRPNIMIKVPATEACLPVITELISSGINVNVTLIFSLKRYLQVINAYTLGLERLDNPSQVRSVASFFVSRVDTEIDSRLQQIGGNALEQQGKAAVAQAQAAYGIFLESFNTSSQRWASLSEKGAQVQRPLWASTSTKNDNYPDLIYIENLLAHNSVNTMPDNTIAAIEDHAHFSSFVTPETILLAHEQLESLQTVGINLNDVTDLLENEGIDKFCKSYEKLINSLASKVQD